ncbi:MAG: tetratricopeptide repeat protein [Deltaproteobacteria bacterium]|nr:tetratricopeptide repeat protein [Deltaproteobacteria bacterium]
MLARILTYPSRRLFVLGLAIASLVGAPDARAQAEPEDPIARARVYFEAGMSYFDEGEYERAIPQFERALDLTTAPEILYNLYIAYERIGQFDKATVYLRTYLSVAGDIEGRAQLQSRLEALERRARQSEDEGEEPEVDDSAPVRELPADAQPRTADDAPPPVAEESETEGSTDGGSMAGPIVSYLIAGGGLVALAVGGALALKRNSDLASDCGELADRSCSADDVAPLRRASITADVGLGVAIAGALVGTLLVLLRKSPTSDAGASLELSPAVGRNEGGVVIHGQF